jgi:outer membrane receptor protein involved in Fe transport
MRESVGVISGLAVFVLCLFAGAPGEAAGQDRRQSSRERADSTKVLPLDVLVVTATRTGRAVRDVPANVSVIGRETIRNSAVRTVADLLREVPGFTTRDYQSSMIAHPARQAPAMRGMGGTSSGRALVLIDGVPADDPFAGYMHWARVPLEFVERVEVVRGGGSGIWGNRALGGVIHLITERPEVTGVRARLEAGSSASRKGDVAATWRSGRLGLAVMGEYFNTDGYKTVRPDLRGPIDTNAGSQHEMFFTKLEYDATSNLRLQVSASYLNEERPNATPLRYVNVEMGSVRAGALLATSGGSEWGLTIFGSKQKFEHYFTSEALDRQTEEPSNHQFDVPGTTAGGNLQWTRSVSTRHVLTAGTDVLLVDGENNEDFRWIATQFTRRRRAGGEQLLAGVFVQDEWRATDALRLQAGGRLDRWHTGDALRREHDPTNGNVVFDSTYDSRSSRQLSYNIGARLDASDRVSLRTGAYTAFRAPTLNELYKPGREPGNVVIEANSGLDPERLYGAEIGVDWDAGSGATLRGTFFWSRVNDPIVEATVEVAGSTGRNIAPCGFVSAGGVCRQRRNLGAFRSLGIETEMEWRWSEHWLVSGSYTWNPTKVIDAPNEPALVGGMARGTPEHAGTGRLLWSPSIADVAVTARWIGKRFEDDANTLELDPFTVMDVRLLRQLDRRTELHLGVENLFDAEYEVSRASSGLVRVGGPRQVNVGVRVVL